MEDEIRDLREKERYMTDDKFLNGYARFLEIYAVGVYGSLCRHANKQQRCWPSINKVCEELSIGRNSALNAVKRLEYWHIIKKYRIGKMANNRYDLISKRNWLPINSTTLKEYSEVCNINITSLLDKLHVFATQTSNSKETHSKETKERSSSSYKKKPYYKLDGTQARFSEGKWWSIPKGGGEWLHIFRGEKDIVWK